MAIKYEQDILLRHEDESYNTPAITFGGGDSKIYASPDDILQYKATAGARHEIFIDDTEIVFFERNTISDTAFLRIFSGTTEAKIAVSGGTDTNLELIPKGDGTVRVPDGYESRVSHDADLVNKAYVDNNFGSGDVSFPYIVDDSTENTSIEIAEFRRTTSGTPGNGIGGYINISVETTDGVKDLYIEHIWPDQSVDYSMVRMRGVGSTGVTDLMTILGYGYLTGYGQYSTSIGHDSSAPNQYGTVLGANADSVGTGGIAIGANAGSGASATGDHMIMIGYAVNTQDTDGGDGGIAIGKHTSVTAEGAIIMGHHGGGMRQVNALSDSFKLMWDGATGFHAGLTLGTQVTVNSDPDTNLVDAVNGVIAYDTTDHEFRAYINGSWQSLNTGSGVSIGSDNQIPTVNLAGDDFEYTSNFRWDGANHDLIVDGGASDGGALELKNNSSTSLRLYAESDVNSRIIGRTRMLIYPSESEGGYMGLGTTSESDAFLTVKPVDVTSPPLNIVRVRNSDDTLYFDFRENEGLFLRELQSYNGTANVLSLTSDTTATPGSGLGVSMSFYLENDAGESMKTALILNKYIDATNESEDASLVFRITRNGSMTDYLTLGGSSGYIYAHNSLSPTSDSVYALGTAMNKWSHIYTDHISLGAGTNVSDIQTTIEDDDDAIPTCGAVVDYVAANLSGVSIGSDNQIPVVNSAGDDFEYSSGLHYDSDGLYVSGEIEASEKIIINGNYGFELTSPTGRRSYLYSDGVNLHQYVDVTNYYEINMTDNAGSALQVYTNGDVRFPAYSGSESRYAVLDSDGELVAGEVYQRSVSTNNSPSSTITAVTSAPQGASYLINVFAYEYADQSSGAYISSIVSVKLNETLGNTTLSIVENTISSSVLTISGANETSSSVDIIVENVDTSFDYKIVAIRLS